MAAVEAYRDRVGRFKSTLFEGEGFFFIQSTEHSSEPVCGTSLLMWGPILLFERGSLVEGEWHADRRR